MTYKISSDDIFNGTLHWKRKNNHLKYEEEYKNGIILSSILYYNGKEKRVSNKTIYYSNKPSAIFKEHKYDLQGRIFETTTYNDHGIRILIEQFINEKLTYSCQYLEKRKHGLELDYKENGKKLTYRCQFTNEKKNGIEYCLGEKGIKSRKKIETKKK